MLRKRPSSQSLIDGILTGDRLVLSQAITLIESKLDSDQSLAREVVEACLPYTGKSFRIGITGVPGAGKSTFIDALGSLLTSQGHKVAVLAVDPSSRKTRGSILGDKTRMDQLSHDENAYIRPSPTSGSLGGVTQKTRESLLLCEAAGYDIVIVETVGVGQSETAVHSLTDVFLLLMLPNAGDELQGIKKGVIEMSDLIAVNKADGNFLPKARAAKAIYSQALRLLQHSDSAWRPSVELCSAFEGTGIDDVWKKLLEFKAIQQKEGNFNKKRQKQAIQWMEENIRHRLLSDFFKNPEINNRFEELKSQVLSGKLSAMQAVDLLMGE